MNRLHRFLFALALCLSLAGGWLRPGAAAAEALDWAIEHGRFYTQANGAPPGSSELGYAVVDDDQARMWSEFRRLGGVGTLGYPVSNRFTLHGFVVQATQRGLLQWRPGLGRAELANVMDLLHELGKDDWLFETELVPRQADFADEQGLSFDQVQVRRLALLDARPAIKAHYLAAADPLGLYGLPTSPVEDVGPAWAARFQRAVISEWKQDTAWARAGEVTVSNVGDLARRAGLVPAEAARPTESPPRVPVAEASALVASPDDLEAVFPATRLESASASGEAVAGVEQRLYRNRAILHGPFAFASWSAGYSTPEEASAAFAAVVEAAPGDPLDLAQQVGEESAAFQALDPGDSMAHAALLVWRRDRWLLAVATAGFDPFTTPDDLWRLAQVVDERSADAGALPLDQLAAGIPSLSFDDLWSLRPEPLALARTSLAGSTADRVTNLRLATQQLNNVVVEQGQVLSLNATVGPTTEERGFRMGYAIIGTDTVPDVGGGICQVATTLFQAVFQAGLEITERHPHAYWIPRYRVKGLDATVYDPYLDFKFRNDLGHPVLIQGWTDAEHLTFALFSEAPRREVEISEPEISDVVPVDTTLQRRYSTRLRPGEEVYVEHAHEGFRAKVARLVREGDREVHHDEIESVYRPARNVLLIGGVDPALEEQPTFRPESDDGRDLPH